MKWLALIIDSIYNLKGGAICSVINTFALNGSPTTKHFINRILKEVSAPLFSMIKKWMIVLKNCPIRLTLNYSDQFFI